MDEEEFKKMRELAKYLPPGIDAFRSTADVLRQIAEIQKVAAEKAAKDREREEYWRKLFFEKNKHYCPPKRPSLRTLGDGWALDAGSSAHGGKWLFRGYGPNSGVCCAYNEDMSLNNVSFDSAGIVGEDTDGETDWGDVDNIAAHAVYDWLAFHKWGWVPQSPHDPEHFKRVEEKLQEKRDTLGPLYHVWLRLQLAGQVL